MSVISQIYPVEDPILDWRHVQNLEYKVGKVIYTFNGSGFRDVDHEVEKTPGIKRIVVVGDSVTEGYGVEWESVFSHILQSQLGDHEVINIAAGGLNTPQEIHLFKLEGLAYEPDLVILNFILNDGDFYSSFKAAQRYNAEKEAQIGTLNLPINPRIKRFLKSSAMIYFVKERFENLKGSLFENEEADYFIKIWGKDENRRKVTDGFDKLKALADENNFHVLVVVWPLITDYRQYKFEFIHEWIKEKAEKRGFSTIDLLQRFSRIQYRDLQVTAEDDIHPNALGHKIGADAFLSWYRTYRRDGLFGNDQTVQRSAGHVAN
jgi:lysophospholipase L1-like esterase